MRVESWAGRVRVVGGYFSAAAVVSSVRHATVLCGAEARESPPALHISPSEKAWYRNTRVVGWSPRRRKIQHDRGAVWASTLALLQDEHYYSRSRKQVL